MRSIADAGVLPLSAQLSLFSEHEKGAQEKNSVDQALLPEWMQLLGLGLTATLQDANAVYRARAKGVQHDEEALIALNSAIEQARHHLKE
jgi:hypothetical protein